jgi:hypothetical protein
VSEKINSEALDKLFEIDGELYGVPSLVRMARIRASILHTSSAWGSSDDGALIGALADEVERLRAVHSTVEAELTAKARMVTMADRIEAAEVLGMYESMANRKATLNGSLDMHPVTEAFARHRRATQADAAADVVERLRAAFRAALGETE